jgi:uncharacterized metal-binding protein
MDTRDSNLSQLSFNRDVVNKSVLDTITDEIEEEEDEPRKELTEIDRFEKNMKYNRLGIACTNTELNGHKAVNRPPRIDDRLSTVSSSFTFGGGKIS